MPRWTHRLRLSTLAATAALAALLVPMAAPAAGAAVAHPGVVSERPVGWTPHVLDGTVLSVARVGETIVVGGNFTEVTNPDGGRVYQRRHLFAFERGTGRISADFTPALDGPVTTLAAAGDGVVVGGSFTTVNGEPQRGLTKLDPADGGRVPAFAGVSLDDGQVNRVALGGGHLYVAGRFQGVNDTPRTGIARLDARSGALDPDFAITVAESRSGPLEVQELALSPRADRLVINGTFTVVEGRHRAQIAMIDTGGTRAVLSDWYTRAFEAECGFRRMNTYMRQLDFAPDGSYFVVVTSGSARVEPGLCKTASRWEVGDTRDARPTWVNHTGGDSLYSVAVTGAAVYVGGHQRWMDNRFGDKYAGPGAVERDGIAAIHPRTGRALSWNPGRTRGHGAQALLATADGLYVGSDTEQLAGRYHARLGMFPLP